MKKHLVKRFCCVFVSIFMSIGSITVFAQQQNDILYAVLASYDIKCVIKDDKKALSQEQKNFVQKVFDENFPEMWNKYGYSQQAPIITFAIDSTLVPEGNNGVECGNGLIALRESVFLGSEEEIKGIIIHELSHVAQDYDNKKWFSWLSEGIADYIAAQYSSKRQSNLPTQYKSGELYDGYMTTAGFLTWLEKKYPDSVMKLHRIMQKGKMEYEVFQNITGKTLSDLWKEYSGKTLPSIEKYYLNIIENENNSEYNRGETMRKLGDFYIDKKDPQSITWYEKAITLGNPQSQNNLGNIYYYAIFGEKNIEKAKFYFLAILENSNAVKSQKAYAMMRLGDIYYDQKDPQAITWYEKATNSGHIHSQNALGYIYLKGIFGEKDIEKAKYYFTAVLENVNANNTEKVYAMMKLGDIYIDQKDPQAIIWYEKAANLGDVDSQTKLGNIYLNGVFGDKDIQRAQIYFTAVLQNPNADETNKEYAKKMLEKIE